MIETWVALSACLSLAGWVLSCFGILRPVSYAVLLPVLIVVAIFWGLGEKGGASFKRWVFKRKRTFGRRLPRCFAFLALLALLGALAHLPNNHDALSYRVPRMLHWLAQGGWHWFDATDPRMNSRTCGTEWMLMPLLAFTHSDRLFWTPNFFCFLLLPGLLFRIFRIAGARRRVAWNWMWLLPMGYGFILQAGSIANDLPAVVFGLAAVDFAVRARRLQSFRLLMLSMLSASLLTGVKTSNAPLMLVWVIPALASYRLVLARPLSFLVFGIGSVLISFIPTAILNIKYCGDWTGYVLEKVAVAKDPITGILGNTVGLLIENSVPPVFPMAGWWNAHIESMPVKLHQHILRSFEPLYGHVWELQQEEIAGLGFGIMLLIAACFFYRFWEHNPVRVRKAPFIQGYLWWGLVAAPWVSLLVYMSKAAIYPAARLLLPFYPFLLIVFLRTGATERALRDRIWKPLVQIVFLLACMVLILTPSRPLWPSQYVFSALELRFPGNAIIVRAKNVYYAYATRHDLFAPLLSTLPSDSHTLGWISGGAGLETDLWRPFGSRVVSRALITDSMPALIERGIHFIVMNRNQAPTDTELESWLRNHHATVIYEQKALLTQAKGIEQFALVRITDVSQAAP